MHLISLCDAKCFEMLKISFLDITVIVTKVIVIDEIDAVFRRRIDSNDR